MLIIYLIFFFNDTATTEIYTLSLHDALPILRDAVDELLPWYASVHRGAGFASQVSTKVYEQARNVLRRSEEHTSELQSRSDLVCRLLLEKKKNITSNHIHIPDHHDTPSRVLF